MFFLPFSHHLQLQTSSWMRESTQWRSGKVGMISAFICAFWSNDIRWHKSPYWTLLGHFFDLPVAHLILSTGETCRWLKLLTVWDAMFVCRVDIQRSVGLGRKNEKWRHQGPASINRLVEFMCLPSADGLKWAHIPVLDKFQCWKRYYHWTLLLMQSPPIRHTCVVTAPFVFGNDFIVSLVIRWN